MFFGVMGFAAGPALADTIVSVGAVGPVNVGDAFAVDVNIANVSDLYDFQLDLTFDSAVVQLDTITEGAFLSQGGATFFFPGFIDNSGGTATFNADTLLGAIPGVNGSGVLLQFDFQALAAGSSGLSLSNVLLQDSTIPVGANIDFSSTDGSVTVTSAGAVATPEPNTLTLFAGAIGAGFLLASLRRGLRTETIRELVRLTGPRDGMPGFTFSDLRSRLFPDALCRAFPTCALTGDDLLQAAKEVQPSPAVRNS